MKNQYSNTPATKMLVAAIEQRCRDGDFSVRYLAEQVMRYNNTVVYQMMAGRVPIPIDRVPFLCSHLPALNEGDFLWAVLVQRHPTISGCRKMLANIAMQRLAVT